MSEILFFTDIHIHAHKGKVQRLEDCLRALRWVFETAANRSITSIVFLGDLFQHRQKIDTLAYYKTFQIMRSFPNIKLFLLVGNHDMWFHDKWEVTGVAPLSALPNVTLIAEPCTLSVGGLDIDFLPYTLNPIEVISRFKNKARLLCAHIAVDDAQLNKLYNVRSEVSVEIEKDMVKVGVGILEGWERVFLGHYHGEQRLTDRVEYIGSPLQLSFGEAAQKKHIIAMDADTLQKEYIENSFSPKHLVIKSDQIDDFDLDNNFVIIQVPSINSSDIIDMRKNILETKKVQHLEFKEMKTKADDINKEEIQSKFDIAKGDVLERYIAAVDCANLDREMLLKIGKEICQGEA